MLKCRPLAFHLALESRSAVEALTRGLINKVLHQPLQAMKAAARNGDLTVVEAVQQIFGLPPQGGLTSQDSASTQEKPAVTSAPETARQQTGEPARSLEATRR